MPDIAGDMARYNLDDPEDLAVLIDRGLIWRGGPKAMGRALSAIKSGAVPRPTKNVPPEVDAYLDKLGIPPGTPVNETALGPEAEPTMEDPEVL